MFGGRNTSGVKGMSLTKGDSVVSMTVLDHVEVTTEIRSEYLHSISASRRLNNNDTKKYDNYDRDKELSNLLDKEPFLVLREKEEFLLTITENGYGKRSSAYEYRLTNRGGSGIINIITSKRNGPVVASFSVEKEDQVMLVTDRGKLIRSPVVDVRIAGRNTQGVTLFKTSDDEKVVSVARLADNDDG